jgi:hypothetical protein
MPSNNRRVGWIVAVVIALVVVGVGGYWLGSAAGFRGFLDDMPMRGYYPMRSGTFGLGSLLWLLLLLGLGALFVAFVVRAFEGRTPPSPPSPPSVGPSPDTQPPTSGVDQLRTLAELHDQGKLTDEEFAAAKRKLLGL